MHCFSPENGLKALSGGPPVTAPVGERLRSVDMLIQRHHDSIYNSHEAVLFRANAFSARSTACSTKQRRL